LVSEYDIDPISNFLLAQKRVERREVISQFQSVRAMLEENALESNVVVYEGLTVAQLIEMVQ
jgi:hypothetical protein